MRSSVLATLVLALGLFFSGWGGICSAEDRGPRLKITVRYIEIRVEDLTRLGYHHYLESADFQPASLATLRALEARQESVSHGHRGPIDRKIQSLLQLTAEGKEGTEEGFKLLQGLFEKDEEDGVAEQVYRELYWKFYSKHFLRASGEYLVPLGKVFLYLSEVGKVKVLGSATLEMGLTDKAAYDDTRIIKVHKFTEIPEAMAGVASEKNITPEGGWFMFLTDKKTIGTILQVKSQISEKKSLSVSCKFSYTSVDPHSTLADKGLVILHESAIREFKDEWNLDSIVSLGNPVPKIIVREGPLLRKAKKATFTITEIQILGSVPRPTDKPSAREE